MDEGSPGQLAVGATFHDRYRIVRRIKAGGMGAVYEVVHLETRRRRALKVMLPSVVSDPELRDRFKQEATIAADITSDHIVETFDAGVDTQTGTPFLVMELLEGEDLGQTLKTRGRLSPEEVAPLIAQAAFALDKTHAAGIVHRDLKPENLYITRRDDGSIRLKVLDFGIAKLVAISDKSNNTTRALGSPLYMSPEQLRGRGDIGPPADLYALGHVAYKLLTGASYWEPEKLDADNIFSLIVTIGDGAQEPASARAAKGGVELPPAFDAWFMTATAVRPADRYRSASVLAVELAKALGQPIGAAADEGASRPHLGDGAALSALLPAALPASLAPPITTADVSTAAGVSVEAPRRNAGGRLRFVLAALGIAATTAIAAVASVSYFNRGAREAAAIRGPEPSLIGQPTEPSAEPSTIPSAPVARMVEASAESPTVSASEPSASAKPDHSAAAPAPAKKPFNYADASRSVEEKARIASFLCRGLTGPKAISASVVFVNTGAVIRVENDPMVRATPTGNCASRTLYSARTFPFEGPSHSVPTVVALE